MSQSPFQRFIRELRRRHVPQTAAIYLVAAWAAIEFADVVVPNLNGPQWVVTAVIVAALVGFPVMLVVAWIFEWGPEGIHRTPDAAAQRMEAPPTYDPEEGAVEPADAGRVGPGPGRSQPWIAAVAVLLVGIGSAVGVAYVIQGGDDGSAPAADAGPGQEGGARSGDAGPAAGRPGIPPVPEMDVLGPGFAESIDARIRQAFRAVDSMDLSRLAATGRQAALQAGAGVLIARPMQWQPGDADTPVPLAEGDTLEIEGVAFDSAGIAWVTVDGREVVDVDNARPSVPFTAALVGTGGAGSRAVPIVAHTADGRTIERVFTITQLPGGTP